ncbi:phosphopantothenoylcysteine decarboxylase / phosphopantothenate--cysteine ligase [Filimonas lacunae]|uniref:Phosphopantothenoylcysteine decarboxylase / phosphopantothenate--cysteine ligase n=1 Tax=Filimonas lacunae TaxID=477680 RepID=A0A173MBI4_9BACT|nr:flavoprotein [Filimonas lacunae]BAV04870.1 phosphopantothenoylcysteine decarboxylase [Filimonas lacunae]SIT34638.1 phosphopantothenoylcysteine decarboxylase / phosphopantothenate--cysteine ligase [Filimonas lacunae]
MRNIALGITGAVSAAAMPSFIMHLRKELNCNITVMVSKNATQFVTPYALRIYSGNEVFTDTYAISEHALVPHVKLSQQVDLMAIMPASSNIIAKAANGISDDIISTAITASSSPVLFVPSMNEHMWRKPSVQANVDRLKQYGYHVLEPERGLKVEGLNEVYGAMASLKSVLLLLKQFLP